MINISKRTVIQKSNKILRKRKEKKQLSFPITQARSHSKFIHKASKPGNKSGQYVRKIGWLTQRKSKMHKQRSGRGRHRRSRNIGRMMRRRRRKTRRWNRANTRWKRQNSLSDRGKGWKKDQEMEKCRGIKTNTRRRIQKRRDAGQPTDLAFYVVGQVVRRTTEGHLADRPWGVVGEVTRQNCDTQFVLQQEHK